MNSNNYRYLNKFRNYILILLINLIVISCISISNSTESYEGKWVSLGGNWLLDIDSNGEYTEYDFTSISCQISRTDNIQEFGDRISLSNDTLKIKRGVIQYSYIRSNKDYELCDNKLTEEIKNDPLFNFEVFSSTIFENYAFMELNSINWIELYEVSKEKMIKKPTNKTLLEVTQTILDEINDNHGYIEPSIEYIEEFENDNSVNEIGDFLISNLVSDNHMIDEYTRDSRIVRWGKMNDSIGYINVKAMFLISDLGITQKEIENLGFERAYDKKYYSLNEGEYIEMERLSMNETMSKVMNDLNGFKSIIIDVRFNGGGQDAVSLELLSWFNDSPKLMARQSLFYNSKESPTWDIIIESQEKHFTGDVYLLTSQQTGSACEVFSMGSMVLPRFKRIGMRTMGAMSTTLEKELPNGWKFSLSNEYYRNLEGEYFENQGVPIDYKIDYPDDRQEFFRLVMEDLESDKREILKVVKQVEN